MLLMPHPQAPMGPVHAFLATESWLLKAHNISLLKRIALNLTAGPMQFNFFLFQRPVTDVGEEKAACSLVSREDQFELQSSNGTG